MVHLGTSIDFDGHATVYVEHDYVAVDTDEWFSAVARDVSDYWIDIINRVAAGESLAEQDGRDFYSSQSVSTWQFREAGDLVVKALKERAENAGESGECQMSGWTGNSESNFQTDFGYDAVPLTRGGYLIGWLIFISAFNNGGYDSGVERVLQVDNWEEVYRVLDPEVGYYCSDESHPEEWGDRREYGRTRNSGYSFEVGDSCEERTDVIEDSRATCSMGHNVELYVEESW